MTPTTLGTTTFWAVAAAIMIVVIGVCYRKFIVAARTGRDALNPPGPPSPDEAQPLNASVYEVALTCRIDGHAYGPYNTGWRCATCGNHVARREGELYGPAGEGRTERRRQER